MLRNIKPGELGIGTPFFHQIEKLNRAAAVKRVLPQAVNMPLIIVIARRTLLLKGFSLARFLDDRLHPFFLGGFIGLNARGTARLGSFQNMGEMDALFVQRISIGCCKRRLGGAEKKRIGKVLHMHAMKRGDAVCPFLRDGLPTDTVNLIARAPRIIGRRISILWGGMDCSI